MNLNPGLPRSGAASFGPDNTPYDALGGDAEVRALVDAFYDLMDRDPAYETIRRLHPDALAQSRDKLYKFLSGWLGGPPLYVQEFGHPRLRGRHMPFPIGDRERDQWMACMRAAMAERDVPSDLRAFLDAKLHHVATFMRNVET